MSDARRAATDVDHGRQHTSDGGLVHRAEGVFEVARESACIEERMGGSVLCETTANLLTQFGMLRETDDERLVRVAVAGDEVGKSNRAEDTRTDT